MKKLTLCLILLVAFTSFNAFSQTVVCEDSFNVLSPWNPSYGSWMVSGGELVQTSLTAGMAMINRPVEQAGVYQVEFTASYIDGGFKNERALMEGKLHGGFGIHVGVDTPPAGKAWGNSKSYLLWVNMDTEVSETSPHYGFRAQVYKSDSHSRMNLVRELNTEIVYPDEIEEALYYLDYYIPFRIVVNTENGEVRIYDPVDEDYYYYFNLDPGMLKGSYVSLRTNSLSMAFDDFRVSRLR